MVRRGVLLDVPGRSGRARRLRARLRDHPRRPGGRGRPRRAPRSAPATWCWSAAAGAGASTTRTAGATSGTTPACPGVGEAGASWLADQRRPRRRARTPSPSSASRPGAGHALLPAHRVLLVERGIYIIETLDLEELAADGVHEFLFVLSPLALFGATGSPVRPLAVIGRWLSMTLGASSSPRFAAGTARRPPARRRSPPACASGCWTCSGSCVAAHRLPTSRAAHRTTSPTRAGAPRPTSSACPTRCPPRRPRSATASWRTRWTTTTPTCPRCCTPAPPSSRRRSPPRRPPAPTARAAHQRDRGRPGDLRPAGHGRLRPRSCSNSVFFEHGQHATSICGAMGGAVAAGMLLGLDEEGCSTRSGVAASMAAGIIEANRTGGTVKRLHCGWAAHAAVTAAELVRARLHRAADRAGGPVRLLPGLPARRVRPCARSPTGSASGGRCRTSSSSPTRPTTSPTPPSTPAWRCAPGACRRGPDHAHRTAGARRGDPHHRRADRGQARPGHRLPGAVQRPVRGGRRPARRRRAGRSGSTTSPTSWPATRSAAPLMAKVDVVADDECDAIFPAPVPGRRARCAPTTAGPGARRCSPTAAARSARCPTRSWR